MVHSKGGRGNNIHHAADYLWLVGTRRRALHNPHQPTAHNKVWRGEQQEAPHPLLTLRWPWGAVTQ
ncbi:hypothetical protein E2C01_080492 [Portunus trituberculatus]|uniref:Uncharacterized protein n=1 Tax=Portunus trituberculatus TaxID=210409 RepID=A0A5B7IW99_PORTR|nr:hypothetical protein [Portunus trituberculatus]